MKKYVQYLEKNKSLIEQSLEIDNKKWDENFNIDKLFKKENNNNYVLEKNKAYLVIYEGQPEITSKLLENAIPINSSIVFTIKDYYLATNKVLISIANRCIQENKKQVLYKLYNNIEEEKIYEATQNPDETIYIGNEEEFNYIKNNIQGKVRFIEYN